MIILLWISRLTTSVYTTRGIYALVLDLQREDKVWPRFPSAAGSSWFFPSGQLGSRQSGLYSNVLVGSESSHAHTRAIIDFYTVANGRVGCSLFPLWNSLLFLLVAFYVCADGKLKSSDVSGRLFLMQLKVAGVGCWNRTNPSKDIDHVIKRQRSIRSLLYPTWVSFYIR